MEAVRYELDGRVAKVTMIREQSRNAIDPILIGEMEEVFRNIRRDSVRVLVLTGTGSAFCAGADLKMVKRLINSDPSKVVAGFLRPLMQMLRELRSLPIPVIAAVNGACFAGGLETVLCCDLILASEAARFSDAHARHGLLPGVGGVHGLLRSVGSFKAKEMLFSGWIYTAQEMCAAGLVSKVLPDAELLPETLRLAHRLAAYSAPGLASMKQMANRESQMDWEEAAQHELDLLVTHLDREDIAEGVKAFIEKRAPRFEDEVYR